MAASVTYTAKLETWFRRDGRQWLAWCPALDIVTQARTKKKALESLREAVELWFESCIERGVLDKALAETGFSEGWIQTQEVPAAANLIVKTVIERPTETDKQRMSVSRGRGKGQEYIQVSIPAYIAAQQLGGGAHAGY